MVGKQKKPVKMWMVSVIIIGIVITETLADYCLKRWSLNTSQWGFFVAGMLIYAVGVAVWALCMQWEDLTWLSIMYSVIALIALFLAGILFFHEKITLQNGIGLILSIIIIILMNL
jgi:drug/metabolite transporter (DMT)-like permease